MSRARQAQEILENPLWKETFTALGHYYYESFRVAADEHTRDRVAIANDMLDDFESFLNLVVNEGVPNVGDNK